MVSDVDLLDAYSRAVIGVVEQVGPAVVSVSGVGTGLILSPDGYTLTNSHVAAAVKAYELKLRDGSTLRAELVGQDPHSDLAVLRAAGSGLPPRPARRLEPAPGRPTGGRHRKPPRLPVDGHHRRGQRPGAEHALAI